MNTASRTFVPSVDVTHGHVTLTRQPALQRKCACGNHSLGGAVCNECSKKQQKGLQTKLTINEPGDIYEQEADRVADQVMGMPEQATFGRATPRIQRLSGSSPGSLEAAPASVDSVLSSTGAPLEPALRQDMEQRFGYDFSGVRTHTDAAADRSARDVNAFAYTVGSNVVFAAGQFSPATHWGRRLLAHELTHVLQQSGGSTGQSIESADLSAISMGMSANTRFRKGVESPVLEVNADRAAQVGRPATVMPARRDAALQRRAAPYIKKVTVHLAPPQHADLDWQGIPPSTASGSDHFTVSTGKGYSDPLDPRGTCLRSCCSDAMTQCAPPWNRPDRVGACCTYYGNNFWTGVPEPEHGPGGWKYWTPIQPWYSSRGIALHQHPEVTGQPIGHGCVRMEEANAKRIHDYSNGRNTNVTIDGRAAPVACEATRRCGAGWASTDGGGARGEADRLPGDQVVAVGESEAVSGLEGELS